MAHILLSDPDPVFRAVVEDRLRMAGHEVVLGVEGGNLADMPSGADLAVLGLSGSGGDDLEALSEICGAPSHRAMPVLVVSNRNDSASRVAALRAGAADFLSKPCDLEELELRCERLVGSRSGEGAVLQGDIANHPLWEFLQFVSHAKRSGELVLSSVTRSGRARLDRGVVTSVEWGTLKGREALLAILGLKEGRFRLVPGRAASDEGEPLDLQEALMLAAWLEDQLEARRAHRPVTGAPLQSTATPLQDVPDLDLFAEMPLEEVVLQVESRLGIRTWDLLESLPCAPQKVRLAVTVLLEAGVLRTASHASGDFPDTREITSSMVLDLAVDEFLASARRAEMGTTALPLVVAAESWTWPELVRLLEKVPGAARSEPLQTLLAAVRSERGAGTLALPSELGKLVVHIRDLGREGAEDLEPLLTVSAGFLVWLDDGQSLEQAEIWAGRLGQPRARGVVIADRPAVYHQARKLLGAHEGWHVSAHAPRSLLGIFRLLQPDAV